MEETEVRDHSKAIVFLSNSSPAVEQIEVFTNDNITTKPSARIKKLKRWLCSLQNYTTTSCRCDISPKVAKCLELSGLITGVVIVLMLFIIPIISHYVLVSE